MSASANVLSIQALEELKAALGRFGGEAQESLTAAAQEIRRTLDWLIERHNHWQAEMRRWQEIATRARQALAACQNSSYHDARTGRSYVPDCSAQQNALLQAQLHLREVEAELRNVQQWTRLVQQAAADYQRQAQRLVAMLNNDVPKAQAFLGRKRDDLERYQRISITAPGIGASIPSQPVTPLPEGGGGITWAEKREILKRMDDGLPITVEDLQN